MPAVSYMKIKSKKTGKTFIHRKIISYKVEQSIEIPADAFEVLVENKENDIMNNISSGDTVSLYLNNKIILIGIIDNLNLSLNARIDSVTITGRDFMSSLLDNSATIKTYYKLTLKDYLTTALGRYNIPLGYIYPTSKFDKIVVDPGENEYQVIERLCDQKNLVPYYDSNGKFQCSKIVSSKATKYHISNDYSTTIRYKDIDIDISNDIVNEVIIFSSGGEKKKNIKGSHKDSSLRTRKRRIINEDDVKNSTDANNKAKQEFFNINKEAFSISVTIPNINGIVIPINSVVRVTIKKISLDCYLYVDMIDYYHSMEVGNTIFLKLKLMPGIDVNYKNNDIPLLPKL